MGGLLAGSGGKGTLNIAGGTADLALLRLFADGTINLGSGTLAVSSLPVLDGQFNWTGGTLRFDSSFSLTSTNVPKLLSLDATLKSGQELTSSPGINVTLQTPLVVNGGVLNPSLLVNQSRLEIRSGSIGAVQNDGLLLGDGTISGAVTNGAAGKIRVDAGKTFTFTGAVAPNAGEINLQGGTLDVSGALTNSATGAISGRGALYTGGLTNNGPIAFSGGFADIHGDVTNHVGAFVTTGGGGVTTFFDDVVNQGQIRTNAGSRTVIFGGVNGAGSFPGTGIVEQLGDTRPGNSPAIVSYGGDLLLGDTSRLFIELGGTTAGSQYDRISVASNVNVDGALNLTLINGFQPQTGQVFEIIKAGNLNGSFASVSGQNLGGGFLLNPITTATSLSLLAAMPGDTDLNKIVEFNDLNNLLTNYGLSGFSGVGQWNAGDFNDDHAVTFDDLNTLLTNYGQQVALSISVAPVPEPSTLALAALGALGLLIAARRKR